MTLTAAQLAGINSAIQLLTRGQAYETPFAEDVIERVAQTAEAVGFLTVGGFYEAAKLNPISTLLKFIVFVGS